MNPSGKIPPQHIRYFRPRHREMMYRLVSGQTQKEIAVSMDITQTRLSIIVNSPLFKKELSKVEGEIFDNVVATRGDLTARIKDLQPKALTVIEDLMMGSKTGKALKRQCAKDILEMDRKKGPGGDDDGLNHFAKVISEAFKMAESAHAQGQNGNGNGRELTGEVEGEVGEEEVTIDIVAEAVEETVAADVDTEDEPEPEPTVAGLGVEDSVKDVLAELNIMDAD